MRSGERVTLQEAAAALGVSEQTARRWVKSGKLKAYRPGLRYLIPASAIEELLEDEAPKVEAPPSPEPEKVSEEQRRLAGYVRPWLLLADSYSERWEKAAAKGTFTMDAYMEFGATTRDIFKAVDWLSRYLERVQGLDPTAGPIGFALRESMMRLARTMGLVSEAALSIFGSNELSKARKQRPEVYSEIEEFLKKEAL